jgi:hypothetical protein
MMTITTDHAVPMNEETKLFLGIAPTTRVFASRIEPGKVKINDLDWSFGRPTHQKQSNIEIDGKDHPIHEMIHLIFYPEDLPKVNSGGVISFKKPLSFRDDRILRNFPDDCYVIVKKTSIPDEKEEHQVELSNDIKRALGIPVHYNILVTPDGRIKVDDLGFQHGTGNGYPIMRIGRTDFSVARIVYLAFHPEDIELYRQRRIRVNFRQPHQFQEGTATLRAHVNDLLRETLSEIPSPPPMTTDTVYHQILQREIPLGVPVPLCHKDGDKILTVPKYTIEFYDDATIPCIIRNTERNHILRMNLDKIFVPVQGINKTMQIPNLILSSAFPHDPIGATIDHINDDPHDHRVTNLQWLSETDNARKGQVKSMESRKIKPVFGRHIVMLKPSEDKGDPPKEVKRFTSVADAARFVLKFRRQGGGVKDTIESHIRRACDSVKKREKPLKAYNYFWEDQEELAIPGEQWIDVPGKLFGIVEGYKVSDKGRVRNLFGHLSSLTPNRYGKYVSVSLAVEHNARKYKRLYVHHLVWGSFHGRLPSKMIIHDKSAPLRNGLHRNHLEDLREGERSEAMMEFKMTRRDHMEENGLGPADDEIEDVDNPQLGEDEEAYPFDKHPELYAKGVVQDKITQAMANPPHGIQFNNPHGRGSYYAISRRLPITGGKDIKGNQSTKISNRVKFVQIILKYIELHDHTVVEGFDDIRACLNEKDLSDLDGLLAKG